MECNGSRSGTFEADLGGPGAETPEAAIAQVLDVYVGEFGGQVVAVRPGVQAVLIDGRRVVVVEAHAAPTGGFWADTVYFCHGYWYEDQGPPQTAPLATA